MNEGLFSAPAPQNTPALQAKGLLDLALRVAEQKGINLPGRPSNCKMPSELSSPAKLFLLLDDTIPDKQLQNQY